MEFSLRVLVLPQVAGTAVWKGNDEGNESRETLRARNLLKKTILDRFVVHYASDYISPSSKVARI
jgi:hypothetical protein